MLLATLHSFQAPAVYRKDFLPVYLQGRATAAGEDPYLPINLLAERYLGALPISVFPHPTPHPPFVGLLLAPLSGLDYLTGARLWLAMELAFLGTAICLLLHIAVSSARLGRLGQQEVLECPPQPLRPRRLVGAEGYRQVLNACANRLVQRDLAGVGAAGLSAGYHPR